MILLYITIQSKNQKCRYIFQQRTNCISTLVQFALSQRLYCLVILFCSYFFFNI